MNDHRPVDNPQLVTRMLTQNQLQMIIHGLPTYMKDSHARQGVMTLGNQANKRKHDSQVDYFGLQVTRHF